jgi:Mn2+/Fe2+ NRAMP family transporter
MILMGVVLTGKYWTFEKLTLFFCIFNLVYIPAALWAMHTGWSPGWGKVAQGFYRPEFPGGFNGALIMMIMANIGTTITPWQIFFQQSAVVDKGMDVKDIKFGKIDTFAGSFLTGLVAIFIIVATGAALHYYPQNPGPEMHAAIDVMQIEDAKGAAMQMGELLPQGVGHWSMRLFAIGLFDAGFLGALCISLSTSWAVGEVYGWAHSLNKSVREAPWFYVVYLFTLASAGVVVLIPGAPLKQITIFVQVVAVTLLPAALTFLILLLNDEPLMGKYVNTRWENIVNWSIVIFVIIMSTVFGISVLYGN